MKLPIYTAIGNRRSLPARHCPHRRMGCLLLGKGAVGLVAGNGSVSDL
jgi:hypothetical protein